MGRAESGEEKGMNRTYVRGKKTSGKCSPISLYYLGDCAGAAPSEHRAARSGRPGRATGAVEEEGMAKPEG